MKEMYLCHMHSTKLTREEMWARQCLSGQDINYNVWNEKKEKLQQTSQISCGYLFAVDVFRGCYSFASPKFTDLLGVKSQWLREIEKQGDLLEEYIHPDDRQVMIKSQIEHSRFIYSLPLEQRNNYQTIYQFRMLNANNKYIRMISRQQVLLKDITGKAWIIQGIMDISPEQTSIGMIPYATYHIPSGELIYPQSGSLSVYGLTEREREILLLISQGLLSKEIAARLQISIYTVHNHRKNILTKLGVDNAIEAIRITKGFL